MPSIHNLSAFAVFNNPRNRSHVWYCIFHPRAFLISFQSGRKKGYRAVSMVIPRGRNGRGQWKLIFHLRCHAIPLCPPCLWLNIQKLPQRQRPNVEKKGPSCPLHMALVPVCVCVCVGIFKRTLMKVGKGFCTRNPRTYAWTACALCSCFYRTTTASIFFLGGGAFLPTHARTHAQFPHCCSLRGCTSLTPSPFPKTR